MRYLAFGLIIIYVCLAKESRSQIIDSIYYGWTVHQMEEDNQNIKCYISSFPENSKTSHTLVREPHVIITRYADTRVEEVSIYSGYEYKLNSKVYILIDEEQFGLFTKGYIAWAKSRKDDKAIIQKMLNSAFLKVRSDSSIGTYAVDEYSLKGIAKAYYRMRMLCE